MRAEAVIVARDVLQLDHDTARDHRRWSCRLLVRAARAYANATLEPTTAGRAAV